MNGNLERIWKEAVVAQLRCYPRTFLEEQKKHENHGRRADALAKIRTDTIRLQVTSMIAMSTYLAPICKYLRKSL
jgi:hypothetical protein